MSTLTVQKLIEQLKKDLFSANGGTKVGDLPDLFLVESAEVEVAISISYEGEAGVKVMVIPTILEGNLGGSASRASTGVMKIKLSPIISIDDLRAKVKKNSKAYNELLDQSIKVLFQGD